MAGTMLKIDIRRGKILDKLRQDGAVSVAQLAAQLGATTVTIRSDLDALEKDGYLIRVQGGAVQKNRKHDMVPSTEEKPITRLEEKKAIAQAVVQQIRDGDTLFINSGTTMEVVAQALQCKKSLNIVTNSARVAAICGTTPSFRVILLGGDYNAQYGFCYGNDAQNQLRQYQADWALLTLNGISTQGGMTTYHAEEATLNRLMMEQAKQVLVAGDFTKVGHTGFFRFGQVSPTIQLMTDRKAAPSAVAALRHAGVKVQIAD